MNPKDEILQSQAWWSGANQNADEALNLARDALQARDHLRCFACLRAAMTRYGWEYHSDNKARRLWDRWGRINEDLSHLTSICNVTTAAAIEKLYHEIYRAVHFARDRRIRRNLPPRDPAARIDPVVPLRNQTVT